MIVRTISGIVGIIIALIAVSLFNTIWFEVFATVIYLLAMYEIWSAFKEKNTIFTPILLCVLGILTIFYPYLGFYDNIMPLVVIFTLGFATITVFGFEKIDFKTVCANIAFGLFVLLAVFSICRLKIVAPYSNFGWDASFLFVFTAVIAWGADVCAYFSGYFFGKRKLAPVLSPKKTVEGAIGGVIGSVFFAILFLWVYSVIKPILEGTDIVYVLELDTILVVALVAAIGSIVGMIGDLFASAVKRQVGIKDYGNIMPGHGGVMDRFDSVFLVAPLVSAMAGFIIKSGGIFNV